MSFEQILNSAKCGSTEAMNTLIDMYTPLIQRYSFFNGNYDEDLHHEQLLRFVHCVEKFSLIFPEECDKNVSSKRD